MVDTNLIWGATLVYVAVMVFLGYLGWKNTKSGKDYLLAGQNVSPWIIGLSYGSTFISTSAIVGFGGYAATWGMGIVWLAGMNIGIGLLLAFVFFGKRVRRLGKRLKAQTFPELLGVAYESKFIRWFMAIVILIGMPLYAAAVLIGGSVFMSSTIPGMSMDAALIIFALITAMYVITGGLKAVMYTDALQGSLMIIGMVVILIVTLNLVGGIESGNQQLTDLSTQVPQNFKDQGMIGWTSMPTFLSENWIVLVGTIILPVGLGVLAQPQLAVRFMTAKDGKALNRAIPWGGVFLLMTVGFAYIIGALSNVYFWNNPAFNKISYAAANGNINNIIPLFINSSQDQTVVVLFMLTLLAAAMSTLSSLFHVMGSSAGYDVWSALKFTKILPQKYRGEDDPKRSLMINRAATIVFIGVSLTLAFTLPRSGGVIAIATAMFFGICASAFLPLFVHMLFSKTPSKRAAEMSLVVGTVTWILWTMFCCTTNSRVLGVCKGIFGSDSLLTKPWSILDPILIALPLSTITLLIVWYMERKNKIEMASV
jgi:SSS family solute:Na+ symporter